MKIITERIRSIISGNSETILRKKHSFDCIRTRKDITRELMISKESKSLLGLISPSLGEGMFIVLVESVESNHSEQIVSFRRYEITERHFKETERLTVNEIKGVCPFVHNYQVPLMGS